MPTEYDTSDIQVLEYPENIQRRPGMYVGGTGLAALHHLAHELVDNAVDEALAGACTHIEVEIRRDGSLTVTDGGRGIPTGMHAEKKRPRAFVRRDNRILVIKKDDERRKKLTEILQKDEYEVDSLTRIRNLRDKLTAKTST